MKTHRRHPLRRFMKEHGYRIIDVARLVKVSSGLVGNVVTGQAEMSLERCIRFHLATGIPISVFARPSQRKTLKQYVDSVCGCEENVNDISGLTDTTPESLG